MGRSKEMIARIAMLGALLCLAMPAHAERRGYTVTNFERLSVNGPFVVRVTTGGGSSAYAEGDNIGIRQISVQVTGRTLQIRRNVSEDWGGYPGENRQGRATLYIATPSLNQVTVVGNGDVEIDRMRSRRVVGSLGGNGRLAIRSVEADELALGVTGSGVIEAGGHAETGRLQVQGPGNILAAGLMVDDLNVNLSGAGVIEIAADREADITASGNGSVTVFGDPGCTNRSIGSGVVMCGGQVY